jgi:4-amino-4-deoxy-L-arabinose transferase-like glycosyltransferase
VGQAVIAAAPISNPAQRQGMLADSGLCLGLVALGVVLRWPQLWNIPVFTDEWDEIAVSLDIVRGHAWPLTNADAYYGALTSYLMAGFFMLFGVNTEAPRLFALIMGVLQILPSYLLGLEAGRAAGFQQVGARLVGSITGLLLAFAGAHILLNSHLAWANSTTPLFTTAALWLMLRAGRRWQQNRSGRWELIVCGLCLGLALQTHVMVAVLIVGMAVGALLTVPRLTLGPAGLLAVVALAVGYANMIAFNILTQGESLRNAQSMSAGYSGGKDVSYGEKLGSLLLSLVRVLGGALDRRDSIWNFLADPILIATIGGAIVGVVLLAFRRQSVLLCALLATVVLLPLVNNRYEPLFSGRYLSPLLPLLFAGLSTVIVLLSARLAPPRLMASTALACAAVLGAYSLIQLHGLYGRLESSGRSNSRVLETIRGVQAMLQPGDVVYLDNRLSRRRLMEAGAGDMERVFRALLEISATPYRVVSLDDDWRPSQPGLVILASRESPRVTGATIARLGLTDPRGGIATPMGGGEIFHLYRAPDRLSV